MRSPIARWLTRQAQKVERIHRHIHGPKYAPGNVVETHRGLYQLELEAENAPGAWHVLRYDKLCRWRAPRLVSETQIIRVVRYAGGEA